MSRPWAEAHAVVLFSSENPVQTGKFVQGEPAARDRGHDQFAKKRRKDSMVRSAAPAESGNGNASAEAKPL